MICPSCSHDNLEGVDRCEECMTPLFNRDQASVDASQGMARHVMEDKLSKLDQEFLSVSPETVASDVIRKMKEARLGCALVLDQGRLVGIFTERDVLNKLTGKGAVTQNTEVKHLMTADPEMLRESDSVATALNKMSMGRYRHIPVEKADGSYAVTSIKHVLKYISQSEW